MNILKKLAFILFICTLSGNLLAKDTTAVRQAVVEKNSAVKIPTDTNSTTMAHKAQLVNINTASAAEIQEKLTGIGEKKAQAIVDYRTKNGNFTHIDQITAVSGIGKATLEKNHDRIILE
ncbi:transporter [[Haemophilus] ducreyi]|uniref:DNA uptake protein n=2 Tax=Haemophilus ducreyi TaxID=730 RepID=Q7VNA6_HAEDU|nr:ComEA family DNA-binding protein [[Haemophilus] ducreyi]AAP95575.1 hypothetical protein HD_0650 [[Haemophilus] ducreyi 35000HP]AKO30654.1 transporter [[Haemophilus] ducreyi]AKO32091.1 transporter [[Haemophilus] ducreyi]AKO33547.1 transporter [[Haemophilus] ducreyi]AKO34993.1 transporter [[Haemophilus] ducreyi]